MSALLWQGAPILFGNGTVDQVGIKLKELKCKRVLCAFDQTMKATGTPHKFIKFKKVSETEVVLNDKVLPEPPAYLVHEAADFAKKIKKLDGIVAIGGGSTIDTCKCINLLINNEGSIVDYHMKPPETNNPGLPLIAIPTTAGTGSESTIGAVVSDDNGVKKNIFSFVTFAILDPELMVTMPPSVTASTGMDALAHAVEYFLNNFVDNPKADALSENAIKAVFKYLPLTVADGKNLEYMGKMAIASTF